MQQTAKDNGLFVTSFNRDYWRAAARELKNTRSLVFASFIVVLRIVVKAFKIPLAAGLSLTFDCYVNSLGSLIYGPVVGLCVGAVSDTLGYLVFPSGAYFLPFILVEMMSSFIFGLFLWRREISVLRVLIAKFTVNLVCNIILTSVFMKWMYVMMGDEKATTYSIINMVRIVKNLVLFPAESVLIVLILGAFIPVLKSMKLIPASQGELILEKKHIVIVILTAIFSVALILFYIFFLKDYISANNITLY